MRSMYKTSPPHSAHVVGMALLTSERSSLQTSLEPTLQWNFFQNFSNLTGNFRRTCHQLLETCRELHRPPTPESSVFNWSSSSPRGHGRHCQNISRSIFSVFQGRSGSSTCSEQLGTVTQEPEAGTTNKRPNTSVTFDGPSRTDNLLVNITHDASQSKRT